MQTQEQIKEKIRRNREVLQDLCVQVAGNVRLETLLNRIVTLIVDSMNVRRASIMTLEEGKYLQIRASYGLGSNIVRNTRVPLGQGISGRVAQEGKPMAIRDVSDVQIIERDEEVNYRTKSFICMPMLISQKVKGVINVTDKLDGSPFDHIDLELLATIAGHTGLLVQNYQLYSRLNSTVKRLRSTKQKFVASTRRLEAFINNSKDAIINVDEQGQVVMFNEPASEYFPEIKKNRSIFSNLNNRNFGEWLRAQHNIAKNGENAEAEYDVDVRSGRRVNFRVQSIPSHDFSTKDNRDVHVMHRFIDITFNRTMEERKQEFMALMAHELRTPLTVLKSYFSILMGPMKIQFDEDTLDMLGTMQMSVDRLHREVGKVMTMSLLDCEDYEIDEELFCFQELMQEVHDSLAAEAEERDIKVHCQYNCNDMIVTGDRKLIALAVENLLKNAVQHSPSNTKVEMICKPVTMKEGSQGIQFTVQDKGPGLSSRDLERIMGRMEQVQHHLTRDTGGVGLGLSIVRRGVELNRGQFIARSSPGKGSCFGFTLPVYTEGGGDLDD